MLNPMKLNASIAYPFSHIKPCGGCGEMTLKDINQLIHSPSSSNSSGEMGGDPHVDYSPISGKPVLVKTKIHTKGGKGSITILRTKG
ncbi:Protein XRI1 [Platanthera guangdongensis]|uniref:Protein XRI1 n=1 Tax=Platanthera guangdongensis TaxID=2320717 RepID=A0ABR2M846_9ASPA